MCVLTSTHREAIVDLPEGKVLVILSNTDKPHVARFKGPGQVRMYGNVENEETMVWPLVVVTVQHEHVPDWLALKPAQIKRAIDYATRAALHGHDDSGACMTERTYGAIERMKNGWKITEVEPHVALKLKAIFPRIPRTGRPPFEIIGAEQVDADLMWFMQRYPLRIADADREAMTSRKVLFEKGQAELGFLLSEHWKPSGAIAFREGENPYVYQSQAAELCRRKGGLLLADDLGLGKTVSALATICDPVYLPALIVAPTHLVDQWVEKIREFTHLDAHVIRKSKPYELPKADIYLITYTRLSGWIDYAERSPFRSLVMEEAHELRNGRGTSKGKAVWAFRQQASLALALTATPIFNYGSEIFPVMEYIEQGALGTWNDFVTEWCRMGPGGKWVVNDPAALGTFLREKHLMLRRTNADVGKEHPPINVLTPEVPYDESVIENEEEAMRALAKQVLGGSFTERGMAAREFDLRMRRATGVAKAPYVAQFAKMILDDGEPLILCGWHREVYDIWLNKLAAYNPLLYTGSETPRQKERTKRAFIEGRTNLLILSLRSGAGIDGFQRRCNHIMFGELDWSPKVHDQCVGRIRRPLQTRQVNALYVWANGGSDPSVMGVLGVKASQSHGIVDPLIAPKAQHTDETRIRELAKAFLEGRPAPASAAPPPPPPIPVASPAIQHDLFGGVAP